VSAATAPPASRLANFLPWPELPATGAPTGGGLDLPARKRPPRGRAGTALAARSRKERDRQ